MGVIGRIVIGKEMIEVDLTWTGLRRSGIMLAGMLIYILVFRRLGFIPATALLILFQSWFYGERNWIKLSLLALVFPPAVYFLFLRVFRIMLPRGIF